MAIKDDLWEWYSSLNEVEQLAIAHWLVHRDSTLLLAFHTVSDELDQFCRSTFIDGCGEEFL